MKARRSAAFTLIELLITTGVATLLGGILYAVATENLNSFARNASINRAYTDARASMDRMNSMIDSAGQLPQLLDANGVPASGVTTTTTTLATSPSTITSSITSAVAGVRFYYTGALPSYQVPQGDTSSNTLTVNITPYQMGGGSVCPIAKGDLATIPLIGFQDTITNVSALSSQGSGYYQVTLTFANNLNTKCQPPLPTKTVNNKAVTVDTSFTPASGSYYTCVVFRQAAFIAVPKAAGGAELRYYPQAMSTGTGYACSQPSPAVAISDFNDSTAFSKTTNYRVIANLSGSTVTAPTGVATVTPLAPFQLMQINGGWTLVTSISGEGPDYNNRNYTLSNTFSLVRSSQGPRSPTLLH